MDVHKTQTRQPAKNYLASAPQELVAAHQTRQIGQGVRQLESLITDPRMQSAWRELNRHKKREDHGMQLFQEIRNILHVLRRRVPMRRSEERNRYLAIAEQARTLSSMLQEREGQLNKQAYEYFPAEVMHLYGLSEWATAHRMARSAQAHELLRHWPSFIDMLGELASQAQQLADEAMTKERVVDRQAGAEEYRRLYFVRALTEYINREYGAPLNATVARIGTVILGTEIGSDQVEKMIRNPRLTSRKNIA